MFESDAEDDMSASRLESGEIMSSCAGGSSSRVDSRLVSAAFRRGSGAFFADEDAKPVMMSILIPAE